MTAQGLDNALLSETVAQWEKKIVDYRRKYVTMQDDGSEDDLSYIKVPSQSMCFNEEIYSGVDTRLTCECGLAVCRTAAVLLKETSSKFD